MSSTLLSFISIFFIEFLYVQGSSKFLDDLKPIHYKIMILTKLEELQFEGSVDILMKCYKETKTITLHAAELAINKEKISVVIADNSKKLKIINIEEVSKQQFLKICLLENLRNNTNYNIRITFSGVLQKGFARGFYISHYLDEKDVLHTTANTHFEPTFARYAFPCFDLPHMKATFQVTIGRNRTLFSLNNMPVYKSEPIKGRNGWFWDRFRKTLPMPTYLVAFAVLDSGMKHMSYGKINIWFPPRSMLPKYIALEKATKILNFLEKYFNMAYKLPKLDILLVDNFIYFADAAENWGLITVKQSRTKQKDFFPDEYVSLIAHELVHQWIGNVVTMKCFGEVWLKEGITSYVTNIAKDVAFDGQTIDLDVAELFISIMNEYYKSPPLSVDYCPEEMDDILMRYSSSTYQKGGLFTRMIGMTLGMNNLRKPLNLLLKKHKFGNINENDLWAILMESTPLGNFPHDLQMDVVLKSWTKQDGIPLVQVTRNFKSGTATLTQRKFYPNDENTCCWWIPISYTTKSNFRMNNPVAKSWMNCPKEPMTIRNLNSTDWILMNLQSAGFFIVKYDDDNWNLLTQTLRDRKTFEMIPYWNRFRLILDSIFLTYFGLSSHESILTTLLYLKHETKHIVWKVALGYLDRIDWLEDDVVHLKNKYMKELVAPHFSRGLFNLRKASLSAKLFRREIITQACQYGDEECIEECLRLFNEYKNSFPTKTSLDPSIRVQVFCVAIKHGPEKNAEFLENIVSQVVDELESMQISSALVCSGRKIKYWTHEIGAHDKYLALMKSSTGNNYVLPRIWAYIPTETVVRSFNGKSYSSVSLVDTLSLSADYIHETSTLDKLKVIFGSLKDELIPYKRTIDESFRKIQRNIEWKKKYSNEIKATLSNILRAKNIEDTFDNSPTYGPSEKSQSYRIYSSIIYPIEICLCIIIVHSKRK